MTTSAERDARRGPRSVDTAAVIDAATRRYRAGAPIDMSELAAELGVGRATLYRRVGKHDDLLGAVLADRTEAVFRSLPRPRGTGVDAVCEVLAAFVDAVLGSGSLQALISRDPALFARVVIGPGRVEDRGSAMVQGLIEEQLGTQLLTPPHLLARAIVRISDATMYTHLLSRRPAETSDLLILLHTVIAAAAVPPVGLEPTLKPF